MNCQTLIVVLGDQLDPKHAILRQADPTQDRVWMAEVPEESSHVPSHKARTAVFLAAMRHFHANLGELFEGESDYLRLGEHDYQSLGEALADALAKHKPERVAVIQPGDTRVQAQLEQACADADIPLRIHDDPHFLCPLDAFEAWADGRKLFRMEDFYRMMRKRTRNLIDEDDKPAGGEWNFDSDNRKSFGKDGPDQVPSVPKFEQDEITQSALDDVAKHCADHPGSLDHFNWPVTPSQARDALTDFVENRLAKFGDYQDAMWTGEPFLNHSLLSSAMNLKLIDPRDVIDAAVAAWEADKAPINAVEGFVRQILGWREYVRGLYYLKMPDYLHVNALEADQPLPWLYWTGDTEMACLADAIGQTLDYGYAHHIQRLMVTGLFSLMLGVAPREIHAWYLAVYVDAVEWVELPNTIGMSQYADGGLLASKPYIASGKYIQRMSNYCAGCKFDPAKSTGDDACPFTTLYWDFLGRHEQRLADNNRMRFQVKNYARKSKDEQKAIAEAAKSLRARLSDDARPYFD